MQAATVDMLVQKAKFEPPVAVVIAEAIDMAVGNAQFVTIPALDARFAAAEAKMNARFAAVNARFEINEAKMNAGFETADARTDAKLQKIKTDFIFWLIAVVVGNSYLPKIAAAIAESFRAQC